VPIDAAGQPRALEVRSRPTEIEFHGPRWLAATTPITLSGFRAARLLDEPDLTPGGLEVVSVLRPDQEAGSVSPGQPAIFEVLLSLAGLPDRPEPLFRVTLAVEALEGTPLVTHLSASPGDLGAVEGWLFRRATQIPEDFTGATVVVEELRSGRWGAAQAEISDRSLDPGGRRVAEWNVGTGGASEAQPTPLQAGSLIRLLPPRREEVSGPTRFDTMTSDPAIRRVDFFLDGVKIASDDRAPFRAVLDLGPTPAPHAVRVVAFSRHDQQIGEHEIQVNRRDDSFRVRIVEVRGDPANGEVDVSAQIATPGDRTLDRVEFYWNEALKVTLEREPFRAALRQAEAGPQDYLRVVAYLDDGTWLEDAVLLDPQSLSERLEVNLVELNVMVTDRKGTVVFDLRQEEFRIRQDGQLRQVERFAKAQEVPLVLGLVIDTSESMWALMPDTKKAGAQFLAATVSEIDQAFLVDFDTQPRLAQATTDDLIQLFRTFNSMQAEGFTALYDAVIFSLLQFEEAEGRKALVLLTDGDDYRSQYGPRRCIDYGQQLGVPVYIISLAGIQNARRNLRKIDLEGITEGTGGRVFYIQDMSELGNAYEQINAELRNQYILTFSTARALTASELRSIEVEVPGRKDLRTRTVVAGQGIE
jgi:Ca-activated chloride channel family protein